MQAVCPNTLPVAQSLTALPYEVVCSVIAWRSCSHAQVLSSRSHVDGSVVHDQRKLLLIVTG